MLDAFAFAEAVGHEIGVELAVTRSRSRSWPGSVWIAVTRVRGLGAGLLRSHPTHRGDIGCRGLLVDAESERARDLYRHLVSEFEPSPTDDLHLVLLLKDIKRTLAVWAAEPGETSGSGTAQAYCVALQRHGLTVLPDRGGRGGWVCVRVVAGVPRNGG